MPGLIRKLVIFAAVDGLILQSHSSWDFPQGLLIDYKTRRLSPKLPQPAESYNRNLHLESHGVIGLLSVASKSFLIAITKREQVAQIFGKPIYVITDVALLPISSQRELEESISKVNADANREDGASETDNPDGEPDRSEQQAKRQLTDSRSGAGDPESESEFPPSGPTAAEGVSSTRSWSSSITSHWFSPKPVGLGSLRLTSPSEHPQRPEAVADKPPTTRVSAESIPPEYYDSNGETDSKEAAAEGESKSGDRTKSSLDPSFPLLPRLLRSTRRILSSRSFYFAYDYDLTRRIGGPKSPHEKPWSPEGIDPLYFWNHNLGTAFIGAGHHAFLMPILQGFVGQRHFIVRRDSQNHPHTEAFESLESVLKADDENSKVDKTAYQSDCQQAFLLTLISRRSTKRSGLRYLRRGIDDEGNTANSVETEQILSSPTWTEPAKFRSFTQTRGSIPLYFSQSPFAFKPIPIILQSPSINRAAFAKHFDDLGKRYGLVQIALLVDKHGGEVTIGEEYEKCVKRFNKQDLHGLGFEWFDFHAECRGMKFENVARLVDKLQSTLASFGETVVEDKSLKSRQTGIIRTNCMDCLDRTNVAQSAFAQFVLQKDLHEEGFEIDLLHDPSTQWFNTLWADNGDAISRQYASTAALKGDFTRTRRRNYRGALNDLGLTLSRYYNNMVNDYFAQTCIDILLGNVAATVLEDFEATMASADPGISVGKLRAAAVAMCRKIVVADDPDERFVAAWPVLTPQQPNTLRTLPFEESVLLLTDAALYACCVDWATETVQAFERIDLRAVSSLVYGAYVTSTFSPRQMDEAANVGIAVVYQPGHGSGVRVNTRSLQSAVGPGPGRERERERDGHGGVTTARDPRPGVLAWLASTASSSSGPRTMACKLVPAASHAYGGATPLQSAKQICEAVQCAVTATNGAEGSSGSGGGENAGGGAEVGTRKALVQQTDIISLDEARKRTGYLETLGHSIKKMVWA